MKMNKQIWINNNMSRPLKEGLYKCLVEIDGYGTLDIVLNCKFNGTDWCVYNSCYQFTRYWLASIEEYEEIKNKLDKEQEQQEEYISRII